MGSTEFFARRYDGTRLRKKEEGIKPANAYERLQYVCTVLDIRKQNNDRFPYVFEANVEEKADLLESLRASSCHGGFKFNDGDISGEECFNLLVDASGMKTHVSLWCLW
jgi:hypothetical protein